MTTISAWRDGMRRVNAAPMVLVGILVLTFLLVLPLGLVLESMLQESLGSSLAAETAASGTNGEWWQEFEAQATGVGVTFTPRILGFGGVLSNISAVLDAQPRALVVLAAAGAYYLLWTFLIGGILDRYARRRPVRTAAFFSSCGVFFFRFLRLAVFACLAYVLLFGTLHGLLFDRFYAWATHDWTVERNAFLLRVLLYLVSGAVLVAFNLLFDYAKVRAVVEDRRSMIGALLAAGRFIARHPRETVGLYLLNGLLFLVVLAIYALVAPGAGSAGWSMWLGFAVTEAYLLLRIWVKLLFFASEVALFQGSLAHAEYTAAPAPVWPESPAAEAIAPRAE